MQTKIPNQNTRNSLLLIAHLFLQGQNNQAQNLHLTNPERLRGLYIMLPFDKMVKM
ncbi:MAG TPA: hypothetical protein PLL08_03480 [Bacteroidales bacterium]|nr:hypothetical protein [Bacteroidales bacterium]